MRAFLLMLLGLLPLPLAAQEAARPVEVDVELVLAVDVSRSIAPSELILQRRGYAEALVSAPVMEAVAAGLLGQIAVTYIEWAGDGAQRVVVDWTLIRTVEEAEDFAATLVSTPVYALSRTSISGAIRTALRQMEGNGYDGLRRVIDISGDGPNNAGLPVLAARSEALASGVTINGLPLMTQDGAYQSWHIPDLDLYYLNCVIGGPGAFVIPVRDWTEFAAAIRRKLVLEIAGLPLREEAGVIPAQGYDCLIGEKIWAERFGRGLP